MRYLMLLLAIGLSGSLCAQYIQPTNTYLLNIEETFVLQAKIGKCVAKGKHPCLSKRGFFRRLYKVEVLKVIHIPDGLPYTAQSLADVRYMVAAKKNRKQIVPGTTAVIAGTFTYFKGAFRLTKVIKDLPEKAVHFKYRNGYVSDFSRCELLDPFQLYISDHYQD